MAENECDPVDCIVIREIYENDSSSEEFENELERALEAQVSWIIIEPSKLGDETARWIYVGNWIHKTAVVSGLACLATGIFWPKFSYFHLSCGFLSTISASVYTVSWQLDPCCKYQVEKDTNKVEKLMKVHTVGSNCPITLTRKNDRRRKLLHNSLAIVSASLCAWRIYEWYIK